MDMTQGGNEYEFVTAVATVAILITLWMHPWTWGRGDKK